MFEYIVRRLLHASVVLLIITVITFVIIHLAPGGPAMLMGEHLTQADRDQMRRNLGLDRPLYVQYVKWLSALLRGDFGESFMESLPVMNLLKRRLPNTILLAGCALLLSFVVGVPIGVLSAVRRHSAADHVATFAAFLGISVPSFWLAILMIILFSVTYGWLPSSGMASPGSGFDLMDRLGHLIMPMIVLAVSPLAEIVRYTRSSMLEAIQGDYVRTARAKGLSERVVVFRHALRNAFNPVLTVMGLLIPPLIGGSVIVEKVFAWPGMGRLAVDAAMMRDYPVIMGITVLIGVTVALVNLTIDLLYGVVDPRVRLGRE